MKMQSNERLAAIIGERLAVVRKRKPETQRELAIATGVTLSVLNSAIKGKSVPQTDALIALANHYGVSIDWLVGETDRPQRAKPRPKIAS